MHAQAGACIYPTDLHKGSLGKGLQDGSLGRAPEFAANGTEVMFVWGRQDPHVDSAGRATVWAAMNASDVDFSWHEFNGQHAFMRDEGPRFDAELSMQVWIGVSRVRARVCERVSVCCLRRECA